MRILLVEDDAILGDGIAAGLKDEGLNVDWFRDGESAESVIRTETYDLVILDLNLPGKSGLDILKAMRSRDNSVPVLVLTARDTVQDRITGLDSGADDYMIKPFDLDELSARIRALIRRSHGRSSPVLQHNNLTLDPASHQVTLDNKPVTLTHREFVILHQLLEHTGLVLTRQRLEETLYSWDNNVMSNTVEVHIHHLRKKFGQTLIRTIRGVGYIIEK